MKQEVIDNNKELTREEQLAIEEKAIEVLTNMGVRFSVPLHIKPRAIPKRIAWWNKHFPNHTKVWRDRRIPKGWDVSTVEMPNIEQEKVENVLMRNFYIKPLYLGTIDAIRKLYLQIEFDEAKLQEQPIQESKALFKYICLITEIAATAIINNPTITDAHNEIESLQDFLITHLTVTKLKKLSDTISVMMNPGGFTSSIRSIMEIGVTKPKNNRASLVE